MKYTKQTIEDVKVYLSNTEGYLNAQKIIQYVPEVKNASYLREIINQLRIEGNPIVSAHSGYKWSTNDQEIFACIQQLNSRANKIKEAASGLQDYLYVKVMNETDEK